MYARGEYAAIKQNEERRRRGRGRSGYRATERTDFKGRRKGWRAGNGVREAEEGINAREVRHPEENFVIKRLCLEYSPCFGLKFLVACTTGSSPFRV